MSGFQSKSKDGILEHRKKFSWDTMTDQTLLLYNNCLGIASEPVAETFEAVRGVLP